MPITVGGQVEFRMIETLHGVISHNTNTRLYTCILHCFVFGYIPHILPGPHEVFTQLVKLSKLLPF